MDTRAAASPWKRPKSVRHLRNETRTSTRYSPHQKLAHDDDDDQAQTHPDTQKHSSQTCRQREAQQARLSERSPWRSSVSTDRPATCGCSSMAKSTMSPSSWTSTPEETRYSPQRQARTQQRRSRTWDTPMTHEACFRPCSSAQSREQLPRQSPLPAV